MDLSILTMDRNTTQTEVTTRIERLLPGENQETSPAAPLTHVQFHSGSFAHGESNRIEPMGPAQEYDVDLTALLDENRDTRWTVLDLESIPNRYTSHNRSTTRRYDPETERTYTGIYKTIHASVNETLARLADLMDEVNVRREPPRDCWYKAHTHLPIISKPHIDDERFGDILSELNNVDVDAKEEGYELPTYKAKTTASRLLREMFDILQREYDIYSTPDRGVAIGLQNRRGCSVILICRSGGGATCLVNVTGISERSRSYDSDATSQLPDEFIRRALVKLDEITDGWTW